MIAFERLNREMPQTPQLDLLKTLEKHFFKLTTRRADAASSLETIEWLYPLYELSPHEIKTHLDELWTAKEAMLHQVYDRAQQDPSAHSAFLLQPEALMILDLLLTREWKTRQAWVNHALPEKELERLANAFGISFDA